MAASKLRLDNTIQELQNYNSGPCIVSFYILKKQFKPLYKCLKSKGIGQKLQFKLLIYSIGNNKIIYGLFKDRSIGNILIINRTEVSCRMERAELLHIVAHNVKKYRETHNLSQEKFSEKAGISLSFCAAIESERKIPSTYTLRSMADKLGVTTDYFLYGDSAAIEMKLVTALLSGCDENYMAFICRLIAACNEQYRNQGSEE